jgi:hypothetical protein
MNTYNKIVDERNMFVIQRTFCMTHRDKKSESNALSFWFIEGMTVFTCITWFVGMTLVGSFTQEKKYTVL